MFGPTTAGPFQHRHPQSSVQTPFQRLKPICIELLGLAGRGTGAAQTQPVLLCLRRLKTTLKTLLTESGLSIDDDTTSSEARLAPSNTETVLPRSLIEYVFYPISELISLAPGGIASLPDSVEEESLNVIALLCSQWWEIWSKDTAGGESKLWQTWCDLMILASSVLGSPTSRTEGSKTIPRASASDEVKLAAFRVLVEVLSPRFSLQARSDSVKRTTSDRWEWDGVSDLPLMDEHDTTAGSVSTSPVQHDDAIHRTSSHASTQLLFPTSAHFSYATSDRIARGAISFVLSSSFSIAESSQEAIVVRETAISVARHALLLWIGGTCPIPPQLNQDKPNTQQVCSLYCIEIPQVTSSSGPTEWRSSQKQASLRLRQILPGITSSLTRLATGRLKPKQGESKPKPTPGPVAAAAIEFLGDLIRATLSDDCIKDTITRDAPLGRSNAHLQSSAKLTDLEDLADLAADGFVAEGDNESNLPKDETAAPDATSSDARTKESQWALSTLAQIHLALKTFAPLTQPSLSGTSLPSNVHPGVQKAILHLAETLLADCEDSFKWLDKQLQSMARLDTSKIDAGGTSVGGAQNSSISTILTWIIDLASDTNSKAIAADAEAAFRALRTKLGGGVALWTLLNQSFDSLPSAITAGNDDVVSRLTLRTISILGLLSGLSETRDPSDVSKLAQDMRSGFVRPICALSIERLEFLAEKTDEIGCSSTGRLQPYFLGLEVSTSKHLSRMFSTFGRSLAVSLVQMLKSDRSSDSSKIDARQVFSIITALIETAAELRSVRLGLDDTEGQNRRRQESLGSLVVAADMLRGASDVLDNIKIELQFADLGTRAMQASKRARKAAHKLGKKVFALVVDMLDGDTEEAVAARSTNNKTQTDTRSSPQDGNSSTVREVGEAHAPSEQNLVERVKGISLAAEDIDSSTPERHGPALDLGFVRAANLSKSSQVSGAQTDSKLALQHRYQQAERSLDYSNALLFNLLSSASRLLGQAFRSLLMRGAYPLVSGMSVSSAASSDLVRQASTSTMQDIAYNAAYADMKNCLLDHADYILGSACQRLISGLDEELRSIARADSNISLTDQQSRAVIRGGAHQAADSQVVQPLVSAQRAPFVLVEMIRVLGSEIVPAVEDAIDEILDALDRFHHHPAICDGLLSVLDSILETMAAEQASNPSNTMRRNDSLLLAGVEAAKGTAAEDFAAWLSSRKQDQPAFDPADDDEGKSKDPKKDEEDKPSKSQQVASQILSKACSFLTHPSPTLRSRILGLLRHGIETLAPQARTAELLPIINTAWPFVMTRLGTSYSNRTNMRSAQSAPIIDLQPAAVGSSTRARNETYYSRMEANLVEKDPQVWLAAAQFVESAAKHVPDFMGKRVVEEAWPRFEQLLDLMRWKFDPRMNRAARAAKAEQSHMIAEAQSDIPKALLVQDLYSDASRSSTHPTLDVEAPFILASASGVPAQLTLRIAATLTTTVRHLNARIPDDVAWDITTHRFLQDLLDVRQPPAVIRAAEELYIELGRRNPEATIWAVQAAFPRAAENALHAKMATPCFMNRSHTHVHAETIHHLVSGFFTS